MVYTNSMDASTTEKKFSKYLTFKTINWRFWIMGGKKKNIFPVAETSSHTNLLSVQTA